MRASRRLRSSGLLVFLVALPAAPLHAWQDDGGAATDELRSPTVPAALNPVDRNFVDFALAQSRTKARAMELARERSPSPELQVLAEAMQPDHEALTASLLQLAANDPATRNRDITDSAELTRLRAVEGEAFDRQFIADMRRLQQSTSARYRTLAADPAASEPVRAHARDALPVLELHRRLLDDAETLIAAAEAAQATAARQMAAADDEDDDAADSDE